MNTPETPTPLAQAIRRLVDDAPLGEELTRAAFVLLMEGSATPAQSAALLLGLRLRGETASDLAGAVRALREAMVTVRQPRTAHLVDTCGTGGGTVSTFNISTAAALVASGAGAFVAKHGNRSYTSKCGSADVLEALGVDFALDAESAASRLESAGIVFLFAPAFHPAMRHVAPVRRELAVPTIMNMVGPLANPAGVLRQVIGVADPDRGALIAEAALLLGSEHVLVVHGTVGMDEIAPAGVTQVWEVAAGKLTHWELDPEDYGIGTVDLMEIAGGDPGENAARIERLVEDPGRDPAGAAAVILNAGAAVYVAGLEPSVRDGMRRAQRSLEDGGAARALSRLRAAGSISTSA